jgi:hypothetical protein
MKSKLVPCILGLLAAYSSALITVELMTSQDYVRQYFDDVNGPVPFFAVNTTLTVSLLWGTALLFGVAAALAADRRERRLAYWFYLSQVLIFVYLGCDDRFKIHELLGRLLGIGDHYVLLTVGSIEALILATIARPLLPPSAWRRLVAASALFAVMIVIDAKAPHDLVLRLSFEDLAKTWSCFGFLLFAWEALQSEIAAVVAAESRRPEPAQSPQSPAYTTTVGAA